MQLGYVLTLYLCILRVQFCYLKFAVFFQKINNKVSSYLHYLACAARIGWGLVEGSGVEGDGPCKIAAIFVNMPEAHALLLHVVASRIRCLFTLTIMN